MGMMEQKKKLLMAQDGFIPPGYQVYEWIKSDPYRIYIDTGVVGNDASLKFDLLFAVTYHQNWGPIFGNYDGTNTHTCYFLRMGGNDKSLSVTLNNNSVTGKSKSITMSSESILNRKIAVHMEYGTVTTTLDGVSQTVTIETDESVIASPDNIFIGQFSNVTNYGGYKKFYNFKISKGGKLIRNYVPVVRKSDSKAGFYDTVNHTFNPSIGSADFTAGND